MNKQIIPNELGMSEADVLDVIDRSKNPIEAHKKAIDIIYYISRTNDNFLLKILAENYSKLDLSENIIFIIDGLEEYSRQMQDEKGNTMLHYILAASGKVRDEIFSLFGPIIESRL